MLLHSRYMRIVTHPAFTIPLFVASLYALYFTPLFDFLMGSKAGHIAMMVHFLAVGVVFFWPIIGVDPGPHRPGYLLRMLELFAGMPFHAFFGIALMMASTPMVETFKNPPASLGIDALSDQNAAGGDWTEANVSASALSELKPTASTLLSGGDTYSLGAVFVGDAGTQDLTLGFLIAGQSVATPGVVPLRILLAGMLMGLLIGLAQALTQVQDQTVAFVPKIVAMVAVLVICLPWLVQKMVEYSETLIVNIPRTIVGG